MFTHSTRGSTLNMQLEIDYNTHLKLNNYFKPVYLWAYDLCFL